LSALDLVEVAQRGTVHFMGIRGAGMTPLAELILRSGGHVTGCDSQAGDGSGALDGVDIEMGHDAAHVAGCAALVVTAAVPADHPEILAARAAGIPVVKRAEALGSIVNRGLVVGIAGTHGKTTTTALTTAVLDATGMDPTGLVGGRVPAWGGNLRGGGGRVFVVEADEYDRSFLTLQPTIAVVTTLEADHLDIYGSLAAVEEAFDAFVERVPAGGVVVGCGDDAGVGRLLGRVPAEREVLTYGLGAGAMLRAVDVRDEAGRTGFTVVERGRRLGRATLSAPGSHNVRNALAAIAVGRHLGGAWSAIAEGLRAYTGVDRRFEHVGDADGVTFIDDYAHHPTELAATLQAARSRYPRRRLVALFQPHLYSRTRDFAVEFGSALAAADEAIVTDVYAARERPIDGVTGRLVADAAREAGARVAYVPERAAVVDAADAALRAGDVCVTLGAGDLNLAARELLRRRAARAHRGALA
jgi:UDP-N-acetylmuramate--alanine ligase